MAKRLTDTEKWKDEWFYMLPADMKIAWIYMIDNCDHAGIWKRNFELLRNSCGTVTKQLDAEKHLEGRFIELKNGDWFFPKFLKFQYSKGIGGHAPAILSVRKKIISLGLLEYLAELFGNSFVTVKDKDKDKDINTPEENKKGVENEILFPFQQSYENVVRPGSVPSIEDVKFYFSQIGKREITAVRFFNHHEGLGWMKGNSKIFNWKSFAQNWDDRPDPPPGVSNTHESKLNFNISENQDAKEMLRQQHESANQNQ